MIRSVISLVCLVLCALVVVPVAAEEDGAASVLKRERIEWCDVWHTDADKTDKPRVLMIGDSITRGYFSQAEQELEGKACCSRYTTSRSICDPVFFQELSLMLSQYEYGVIHFNHGLHGWDYTEEQYAAAFDKLLAVLRAEGRGARLVWASTTPVQPGSGMEKDRDRVAARNAVAAEKTAREGIPVNDLHALSADHPEHFSKDGVHFAPGGITLQAHAVAAAITKALDSPVK